MYQKYHRVSNQIENFNTKPEDYKRLIREYPNAEEYDSVFQIFLHQSNYVKENPDNRYFIDASPWLSLMQYQAPDYLSIIVITYLVASITITEYKTNVDVLNRSSSVGRDKRSVTQILLLSTIGFVLVATVRIVRLLIVGKSIQGTLGYPIQSIPFYAGSLFDTTILGAYFLSIALMFIGVLFLVLIVDTLTNIFKNVVVSFFGGLAILLLPFTMNYELIRHPYPINWFLADEMIRGSELINYSFKLPPFGLTDFSIMLLMTLTIVALLFTINRRFSKRGGML